MERPMPSPDVQGSFRKSENYGSELVDQFVEARGDIQPDLTRHLERAEISLERSEKAARLGGHAIEQAAARAFYETMIRPYLLKGTLDSATKEKTFIPDKPYVDNFVEQLCGDGAISQMYIRLLQSRPGELPTDSRVSFAALELIRTWSIRALIAKELGLNYGINIIDETEAFDYGEELGFTPDAVSESHGAMTNLISRFGLGEGNISVIPFSHQARLYRGGDKDDGLGEQYDRLVESGIDKTRHDLKLGIFSLNAIRTVMIHKLRHGQAFTNVSANTDLDSLSEFDGDDVDKSLLVSESFNSALEMRASTKRHVGQAGMNAAFPEFFGDKAMFHWGISKKSDRVSMQPNFKVYKGRSVTPGYALPVYTADASECLGLTSYTDHSKDDFKVILGPNGLPAALIKEGVM